MPLLLLFVLILIIAATWGMGASGEDIGDD